MKTKKYLYILMSCFLSSSLLFSSLTHAIDNQGVDQAIASAKLSGNIEQLNQIGMFYQYGLNGLPKDVNKAIELYKIGVAANDPTALFHMGDIYYQGIHGKKDLIEALKWFQKSADLGNPVALFTMGNIYEFERGDISQDTQKAMYYFEQAAEKGFSMAYSYLGSMYEQGRFVPQNYNKAAEWYIKGIENSQAGDNYAGYNLIKLLNLNLVSDSHILANIKNIKNFNQKQFINEQKMLLKMMLKQAQAGDTMAMTVVADSYGLGVAEPYAPEKVKYWLEKSALAGNATAAWQLGFNYQSGKSYQVGINVEQDYNQAAYWYVKAYQSATDEATRSQALGGLERITDAGGVITDPIILQQVQSIYKSAPQLTWITEPKENLEQNQLKLNFKVTDTGNGIGDIRVLVNDVVVSFNNPQGNIKGNSLDQSFSLNLPEGEYKVKVEVYNTSNRGEAATLTKIVRATDKTLYKPKLHAVVVGINDYDLSALKLNNAKNDAQLILSILKKQVGEQYQAGDIKILSTASETTKASILSQLQQIQSKASYGDVFIFYFAGHGTVVLNDGYYMLASDIKVNAKDVLRKGAISTVDLRDALAKIPAGKKLILLDTCHSGGALDADTVRFYNVEDTHLLAEGIRNKSGATILMASSSTQQALEGYQGHGVFTYAFAESLLKKNDLDRNGVVDTPEIVKYLNIQVPQITKQIFNKEQTPTVSLSGGQVVFKAL